MRLTTFWRRLRFLFGAGSAASRAPRVRIRSLGRAGHPAGDALEQALLELRQVVEQRRLEQLAFAWFKVDEAKAAAVWYDPNLEPAFPSVLPEEAALAAKLYGEASGRGVAPAALLRPVGEPLPMVRYRLLVERLPVLCAAGGRRAAEAVRVAYELMRTSSDVLSPYGRWLLARAVCQAARDREELERQTERFWVVTGDHRADDGASMMFVGGGEFDLPLPVSLTDVLDQPGMPTRLEALKRQDGPREIQGFFMRLTPRSQRQFMRAFDKRQEAYRHGYPWRKPPWLASEGHVFVRTRTHLPAFFIDRRPVTNEMFQEFAYQHRLWLPSRVSPYATYRDTYLPTWTGDAYARGTAAEPVTGVSYQACRAYVAACGKQLPTEAQWVYALIGPEVPETRQLGAESRPSMSDEERLVHGERAARLGLHLLLPERVYDFDGTCTVRVCPDRIRWNPRGPGYGPAHVWRTPSARGRVPDLAGDANLTFRGVVSASRVWMRGGGRGAEA